MKRQMTESSMVDPRVEARPVNGPVAAAILAAGIGTGFFGVVVTVVEAVRALASALVFSAGVGPLSGKVTLGVAAWLGAWAVMHWIWRDRDVPFRRVSIATIALLLLGLIGTFPPVYEHIAALAQK